MSPEDKEKYDNDNFYGEIKAVLCNDPLSWDGILFWGCEVNVKCNGSLRPVVSFDYITNILRPALRKMKDKEEE